MSTLSFHHQFPGVVWSRWSSS